MAMKLKLTNPFRKTFTQKQLATFRFFSKVYLFKDLTNDELDEFSPYLHLRTYQKNEAIFFRNDPSQALYIIKDGRLELTIDVKDSFETLAYVRKYTSVGNNALLERTKRHFNTIVASEEARIY
ncbi:MAG: cyclic nucleotide-binding domain-containing protein, partial [Bacteroidota bacterium]